MRIVCSVVDENKRMVSLHELDWIWGCSEESGKEEVKLKQKKRDLSRGEISGHYEAKAIGKRLQGRAAGRV